MKAYSLDLREKIVESVKKGVSKSQTAQRFGVDRATVKRYCKRLDECGTLDPSKRYGKRPKLDQRAMKLLKKDLKEKPWATHSQRRALLLAICGARVSEATVRRALKRLSHTPLVPPASLTQGLCKVGKKVPIVSTHPASHPDLYVIE